MSKKSDPIKPSVRGVKPEAWMKLKLYAVRKQLTQGEALNQILLALKD